MIVPSILIALISYQYCIATVEQKWVEIDVRSLLISVENIIQKNR